MKKMIGIALILMLVASTLHSQEKIDLSYRYEVGKSYVYQSKTSYNSEQDVMGQETKASGGFLTVMKITGEKAAQDSLIQFSLNLQRFKMTMKMMGIDSAIDMNSLEQNQTRIVLTKKGKKVSRTIVDSLRLEGALDHKGVAQYETFDREFDFLPGSMVAIGDRWTRKTRDTVPGTRMVTTTTNEYVLEGMEERSGHHCIRIGVLGKIEVSGTLSQMGMEFQMEGSGDLTGRIWFDPQQGVLVAKESSTEQETTMVLTNPMEVTIPMTQVLESSVTLME